MYITIRINPKLSFCRIGGWNGSEFGVDATSESSQNESRQRSQEMIYELSRRLNTLCIVVPGFLELYPPILNLFDRPDLNSTNTELQPLLQHYHEVSSIIAPAEAIFNTVLNSSYIGMSYHTKTRYILGIIELATILFQDSDNRDDIMLQYSQPEMYDFTVKKIVFLYRFFEYRHLEFLRTRDFGGDD
jgi:hypothetical protein